MSSILSEKTRIVQGLTQHFQVSGLILVSHGSMIPDKNQLNLIKSRIESSLSIPFIPNGLYYNTDLRRNKLLPFSSMAVIGNDKGQYSILHIQHSFKHQPVVFIYSLNRKTARNYLDFDEAQTFLDDNLYAIFNEDIHEKIGYEKILGMMFQGIGDIKDFAENYLKERELHKSQTLASGYECFEINFDDFVR